MSESVRKQNPNQAKGINREKESVSQLGGSEGRNQGSLREEAEREGTANRRAG